MPLKTFATGNTVFILTHVMGIYCESTGAIIEFPGAFEEETKQVTVGAVCSGLRSLIALISFGLLFAYITPVSKVKKTILFLATIPASFVANLARILALALVTYKWEAEVATKDGLWDAMEASWMSSIVPNLRKVSNEPVHDFTGIMIFVVAFVALFALERLLTYIERQQHDRRYPVADGSAEAAAGEEGADA
jgi:exosortase/archaeosortase family protein